MKTDRPFFDANVLLYLLSEDNRKADRAEAIIALGGIISVQGGSMNLPRSHRESLV
jgi:predicted nucleic acid-binding protein